MSTLELNLTESETKIILEALIEKDTLMDSICSTSDDEDLKVDVGNDLIELRLLLKELKYKAISSFGESVLEFSNEPL